MVRNLISFLILIIPLSMTQPGTITSFTAERVTTEFSVKTQLKLVIQCSSSDKSTTLNLEASTDGGFKDIVEVSGEIKKKGNSKVDVTFTCGADVLITIDDYTNHDTICPVTFTNKGNLATVSNYKPLILSGKFFM